MIRKISLPWLSFLNDACPLWICLAQNIRNTLGRCIRRRSNETLVVGLFGMFDAKHHQTGDVSDVDVTRESTRGAGLRGGGARVNVGNDAGREVDIAGGGGEGERGAGDEAYP